MKCRKNGIEDLPVEVCPLLSVFCISWCCESNVLLSSILRNAVFGDTMINKTVTKKKSDFSFNLLKLKDT